MSMIFSTILQGLFILLIAPFVSGLVKFCKARLQGRKGASPFLPYFTIATLFKKEMVMPSSASWVFRAVPFVVLASSSFLLLVLPLLFTGASLSGLSDFLIISSVLVFGSVFLVLGGLDPGSAFGGMGSSREMTIAALLEPVVIMAFATMSVVSGFFTVDGMVSQNFLSSHPYLIFTVIALALIALAENARYPVDNPATHLELTMVHEAMILEYSGPYLAMLEYASMLKLTIFILLVANVLFSGSLIAVGAGFSILGILISLFLAVIKVLVGACALALLESLIVKLRFYRMPEYLSLAFMAALTGMIISLLAKYANGLMQYQTFFAAIAVLLVVLLFGRVRLKAILRYYALSALAIAAIAISLSRVRVEDASHLWIFAVVTVLIKSIMVPFFVNYIEQKQKKVVSLASFLRPASSYLLAVVILFASFFAVKQVTVLGLVEFDSLLYASVALMALGLAMLVVHRNVFSQIIGLLIIENGISVFILVTVESLPILIELGVFVITVSSAFILSMLSKRIREFYGSTDTEKLRNLTE